MDWAEALWSVVLFYLRVAGIGFVYLMAKFLVLGYRRRNSLTTSLFSKLYCYIICLFVIGGISFCAWGGYGTHTEGEDDNRYTVVDFRPTRRQRNTYAAKALLALLIPSLLGVQRGFELKPEEFPPAKSEW
jgi:polyferredoxin